MSVTKAKINLKEGTIELEGSEAFVTKYLDDFKKQMKEIKTTPLTEEEKTESSEEQKPKKLRKTPQVITPIPLDLTEANGKQSLRAFYKEKNPKTFEEKLTVFAYYLKNYKKIEAMEAGHVVTCCKDVKSKVPSNIPELFKNIKRRHIWIDYEKKEGPVTITTTGENLVEFDLPRKENAKADKTAT